MDEKIQLGPRAQVTWVKGSSGGAKASDSGKNTHINRPSVTTVGRKHCTSEKIVHQPSAFHLVFSHENIRVTQRWRMILPNLFLYPSPLWKLKIWVQTNMNFFEIISVVPSRCTTVTHYVICAFLTGQVLQSDCSCSWSKCHIVLGSVCQKCWWLSQTTTLEGGDKMCLPKKGTRLHNWGMTVQNFVTVTEIVS